jgi:hypothetical protein
MKKLLLLLLIMLRVVACLGAQEKQRLAVIPFNPVNVPKDQAEVIYTDFERALIATDAYVVIDRDEIIRLLGEGEQSLFSCTSDECGIQIAAQLAGAQVVRGKLIRTSSGYTLEIRLIDIANRRILFMDEVTAQFLGELRDMMELLAYEVAGLVTIRNDGPAIAHDFTPVFIETVPSRADIYINGIRKGISPDLIDRVPIGRIEVSAQYGNFYGEKTIDVSKATREILIECTEVYGILSIQSDENLDVYLDDRWLGKAAGGRFANLPIGIHSLELKGEGLYWQDEVRIRRNEQTVVDVQPIEYGVIEYGIPEGAIAEIVGEMFREVVKGYGSLSVPVGKYSASISGKHYEKHEDIPLSIVRGASVPLLPDLLYTRDYEYQLFVEQIKESERISEWGYRVTNIDLQKLRDLKRAIEQSRYGFHELVQRVDSLIEKAESIIGGNATLPPGTLTQQAATRNNEQLNVLLARKQELQIQMEARRLVRKRRVVGGWISLGAGVAGAGLVGLCAYLYDNAYKANVEAFEDGRVEDAEYYRKLGEFWKISTFITAGVSGFSLLTSSILWLSGPSTKYYSEELASLESEIELLQNKRQ